MPTPTEYGLNRLDPAPDAVAAVIATPSTQYFEDFGDKFEDEINGVPIPTSMGKFVVAGTAIVVAPYPKIIYHKNILSGIHRNPQFRQWYNDSYVRALADGIKPLQFAMGEPVTDAGLFTIEHDTLKVGDMSGSYGRADGPGRDRTIELFRAAVSPHFDVEDMGY